MANLLTWDVLVGEWHTLFLRTDSPWATAIWPTIPPLPYLSSSSVHRLRHLLPRRHCNPTQLRRRRHCRSRRLPDPVASAPPPCPPSSSPMATIARSAAAVCHQPNPALLGSSSSSLTCSQTLESMETKEGHKGLFTLELTPLSVHTNGSAR